MSTDSHDRRRFLALLSMTLGACRGGGSDDGTHPFPSPAPTPAPTPSPSPAPSPAPTPSPAPAPLPDPTGAMEFTLSAATSGVLPFAMGFAFKQAHIGPGRTVAATGADIQATVMNRWPDGSVKFAVLAGTMPVTAGTTQTIALQSSSTQVGGTALTTADLRATGVTASIGCGTFGTVFWAGSDWDAPATSWISGPVMSSWIYRKPIGTDGHLVGWLEVRLFRDGAVEVLPWVENGYFNVAGPTNKSATYSFTLGGTSRYSGAFDLPNHCRAPLLSGAALSHWLGPDPGVVVREDAAYMMATELVPTYWAVVSPSSSIVTGLPSTFTPLQQGSFPNSIGAAGYDPSIGLLPEWDVLYLTSTASSVWAALQRNAYSAGRYGIHHRDETTNRPARFSAYPDTVLGDGTGITIVGGGARYTPSATGTLPPALSPTHMPAMGFMAYLLTGRWYHMETVQFQATANHFRSSVAPREGASGILQTWAASTTRGAAWGLRTLAQAACVTPDSDMTLRAEFLNAYTANIASHHATYVAGLNSTHGWMRPSSSYFEPVRITAGPASTSTSVVLSGTSSTPGFYAKTFRNGGTWTVTIGAETRNITAWDGPTFTATVSPAFTVMTANQSAQLKSGHYYEASWQQDFYTAALGYSRCLGLALDSTTQAKLGEFFAWKAKSIVGRFGGVGATEYLYRDAAAYIVPVATADTWASWYTSWDDVWTDAELYNERGSKELGDGSLRGTISATSYWGNLQPALAYAVRFGVAGAVEAMSLMKGAPNWNTVLVPDFNQNPVWSVRAATP